MIARKKRCEQGNLLASTGRIAFRVNQAGLARRQRETRQLKTIASAVKMAIRTKPTVANATNIGCMPSILSMPCILAAVIRRRAIACEF